jgi:hypothetical protein
MRSMVRGFFCVFVGSVLVIPVHADFITKGHDLEDGRDFSLRFTAGQISDFNVMVQETTRSLYDVTGSYWKQDDAENYNLNDFNIGDTHNTFGFSLEKAWRYVSLQLDSSIMKIESSTVARRNYYIGVGDDVRYEGKSYDQMQIPKHTPFDFSVTGGTIDAKLMATPFTLHFGEGFRVTPMMGVGIFGFAGKYELDAGPVQGVKVYQNPPEEFAIGGDTSDISGLVVPEYGGGVEIRMGTPNTANLVIQGHYTMLAYDGGTGGFTGSNHREKNIDLDHTNIRGRVYIEIPLKNSRSLMLGVEYQDVHAEALISSTATDPAEILEKQERFDKEVEFSLTSMQALIGYTW